jgi:hypothetical protein
MRRGVRSGLWVKARVLAKSRQQGEAITVVDDFIDLEIDYALCSHRCAHVFGAPIDRASASELHGPAAVEVNE